jgi:hypothetical protein
MPRDTPPRKRLSSAQKALLLAQERSKGRVAFQAFMAIFKAHDKKVKS